MLLELRPARFAESTGAPHLPLVSNEANASSANGALLRNRPWSGKRKRALPIKSSLSIRKREADRGTDGKLRNGSHTTQAREHILAASIASSQGDYEEATRRVESAKIHTSHSQHKDAASALEDLKNAGEHIKAERPHEATGMLDSAYGKLQGEANVLLKAKNSPDAVKESLADVMSSNERLRETLTVNSRFLESSFKPDKREVDVLIIDAGLGNARDKHFYYPDTIKNAVNEKVFEGAQCYADHPSKDEDINRPERSIRDLVGYYKNSRLAEVNGKVGYVATLKVSAGADWALALIKEAIDYNKEFPNDTLVGVSINADGDVKPDEILGESVNGVTRITKAFSADIVTKPGRGGKMLALVESASGTSKELHVKFKSVQEAAAFLEKLADGESVDPDDLREAAKYLRETKVKVKEETNADGDADDASAKSAVHTTSPGGKGKADVKGMNEAVKTDNNQDGDADDEEQKDTEDMPMAKGMNAKNKGGSKEADANGGGNLRESHATLYAAALVEAKASVGDNLATLQKENAELKAEKDLRESIGIAKQKLKESNLPEGALEACLNDLIGHTPLEMDRIIEAETARAKAYGWNGDKKQIEGNGSGGTRIVFRESGVKSLTSALIADTVEV